MTSRRPTESSPPKGKPEIITATTPLRKAEGDDVTATQQQQQKKKSGGCCLCCVRNRRQENGNNNESGSKKKKKEKKTKTTKKKGTEDSNGSYTLASSGMARKDPTMGSGITGLSQLTDIPRVDDDDDDDDNTSVVGGVDDAAMSTSFHTDHTTLHTFESPLHKPVPPLPPSKTPGKKKSCREVCKIAVQAFVSIIGLTVIVAAYAIGGGFLFVYLEKPYEQTNRLNILTARKEAVEMLWNLTLQLNILHEELWKEMTDEELSNFEVRVYEFTKQGWDGTENLQEASSWTFASSLLYSLTVITTIGYGNITPKTELGRYLTILYAIIGIPLWFIWLANIGSIMATSFRLFYKQACRFCSTLFRCGGRRRRPDPRRLAAAAAEEGREGGEEEQKVRVPIYVNVTLLLLYILLGSVLFAQWEDEWEMSEAAYFCFITLATIGFGDYVPGFGTNTSDAKAITNALYLIVGLALLAMSFDLMREEVTIIFNNVVTVCKSCTGSGKGKSRTNLNRNANTNTSSGEGKPVRGERAGNLRHTQPCALNRTSYSSKSMRVLSTSEEGQEGEEEFEGLAQRTRVHTISGATGRYGPMPYGGLGAGDGGGGGGVGGGGEVIWAGPGPTININVNNNNNKDGGRTRSQGERSTTPGPQSVVVMTRPGSVPADSLAETVDLLEHMHLLHAAPSPTPSPRMQRRDRSRSPVRGRPKSRGPSALDKGGNVDVATEDEDNVDDDDDDDDTLDAASVASSTDLIKVRQSHAQSTKDPPAQGVAPSRPPRSGGQQAATPTHPAKD